MDSATWLGIAGVVVIVLGGFLKFWALIAQGQSNQEALRKEVGELKDRITQVEAEMNAGKEARGAMIQKVEKHDLDINALWERQRSAESSQGQIRVEFATLQATLIEGQKNILAAMKELKEEYTRHASTNHN